jgi:hypothetical protein
MPVSYQPRFEKYPVYEELAGMEILKYSNTRAKLVCSKVDTTKPV